MPIPTLPLADTFTDGTAMATTHAAIHNAVSDAVNGMYIAVFNAQASSYTLVLADLGKVVGINNASTVNLTIPPNLSVAFPVGSVVTLRQIGAGQITVVAGAGVTLHSRGAAFRLAGQYAWALLVKVDTDTWELSGDITV